ncbi:hypothetical protein CerSpe_025040 [Prunus speciosa]
MAEARTDDLVIRLEELLGISNLESGPKLAGAIIAGRIPNKGAIKTILQNAWAMFEETKNSYIKDKLFTVMVQDEGMAEQIINEGNAIEIGQKLGELKEVEAPWEKGSRGFLRMRVMIDSNNPLPQGFWLPCTEGQDTWVEFKFERLSDFCFNCGKLGHLQWNCRFSVSQPGNSEHAAYGDWMKTRAIRDSRAPVNLHVSRGVRRRVGQRRK